MNLLLRGYLVRNKFLVSMKLHVFNVDLYTIVME